MSYHRDPVDVYYTIKDNIAAGKHPCWGSYRILEVNGKEYHIVNELYIDGRTTTEYYFPKDRGE